MMNIVKKVNIDELVHLLLEMRQEVEHVDFSIEEGNVLKVKKHNADKKSKDESLDNNISDLIV